MTAPSIPIVNMTPDRPVRRRTTGSCLGDVAFGLIVAALPVVGGLLTLMLMVFRPEAQAPSARSLPLPSGWTGVDQRSTLCSGSGGTFCRLIAVDPGVDGADSEATSEFRAFLAESGWRAGSNGSELVLHPAGLVVRFEFAGLIEHERVGPNAVLVALSYVDSGKSREDTFRRRVKLVAAAAVLLAIGLVSWRAWHDRRRGP